MAAGLMSYADLQRMPADGRQNVIQPDLLYFATSATAPTIGGLAVSAASMLSFS